MNPPLAEKSDLKLTNLILEDTFISMKPAYMEIISLYKIEESSVYYTILSFFHHWTWTPYIAYASKSVSSKQFPNKGYEPGLLT